MKHPELLLVPTFMLTDYFLTLASAIQMEKKYGDHFKTEHYELNPLWQKNVAHKKWFNPKHLLLTTFVTLILLFMTQYGEMSENFVKGALGCLIVFLGMVIGRHFCNLMIFSYMINRPDEISGCVTMTHDLVLRISLYQYSVVIVPLSLIGFFSPNPFVIGAMLAGVLMIMTHIEWISKRRKKRELSGQQDAGNGNSNV